MVLEVCIKECKTRCCMCKEKRQLFEVLRETTTVIQFSLWLCLFLMGAFIAGIKSVLEEYRAYPRWWKWRLWTVSIVINEISLLNILAFSWVRCFQIVYHSPVGRVFSTASAKSLRESRVFCLDKVVQLYQRPTFSVNESLVKRLESALPKKVTTVNILKEIMLFSLHCVSWSSLESIATIYIFFLLRGCGLSSSLKCKLFRVTKTVSKFKIWFPIFKFGS